MMSQSTYPSGPWHDQLAAGAAALGLSLDVPQQQQMLDFILLLHQWNQLFNLTGVKEPGEMITRHLLDSLTLLPLLQGRRVLDLGTGAGLPGIPLAIASPSHEFTLLDSHQKKQRFVSQVITDLGLPNVRVATIRAEHYRPESPFDTLVVRAFASLSGILSLSRPLLQARTGLLIAMKGRYPKDEIEQVGKDWRIEGILPVWVPGMEAERHLVLLRTK